MQLKQWHVSSLEEDEITFILKTEVSEALS